MSENKNVRILLYDLETTPLLVYTWGMWEQNVLEVVEESYILCFAYKWLGEKKTHVVSLPDFPLYGRDRKNDLHLVKNLHALMSEADIVVGQNSNSFDNKWANKQFIKHKLDPVSPYASIDTLRVARKHFRFDSNKLDRLGEFLGVGRKLKHLGFEMWVRVMKGDEKAWKVMRRYVKQDVILLEKVYLKLRPWIKETIYSTETHCNRCGYDVLLKRGFQTMASGMCYQRYQCKSCAGWSRSRFGERTNKPLVGI